MKENSSGVVKIGLRRGWGKKVYKDSVASSQRRDFQESRDMTQTFLEYVAKQPANNGPGGASSLLGGDRVVAILSSGGAEYEAYKEEFKKANPAYDIQRVNTSCAQQGFGSQYQAQSTSLKSNHSLEAYHAQSKQLVEQRGQSLGLTQDTFKDSGLKQEVAQKHREAEAQLEVRKEKIADHATPLQGRVDTAREETVVGSNAKQTGRSLLSFAGELLNPSEEIPHDKTPHKSPLNRQ